MENPTKKAVGSLALRKQLKKSPKLEKKIGDMHACLAKGTSQILKFWGFPLKTETLFWILTPRHRAISHIKHSVRIITASIPKTINEPNT